ncbi:Hypp6030 [Branchiostoma lanceolatum]|uniref:Hypp6030 protein n=1 Tax=Branchiostoma lanceolatum TaxID=7740 RepID=A0A8J9VIB3_BRALA|nr:Hypp6030 [Branchiostoma lanceolatum]
MYSISLSQELATAQYSKTQSKMEATFSCPQCSFCVDHDVMLRVLKHFFNCTSFQYIMDLSCGHHPGLGHTHFPGTLKYKHVSDCPASAANTNATPQTCPIQREPAMEEMAENELDDSTTMIPHTEIKTEPSDDTMESPDCTVVEPAAPPTQMMDTAGFREDCHPVSVVCAMGGMQGASAVAGSSNDTDETETHTITTEPVGAPSMVVTRPPSMAATRTQPAGSHGNNDGGTLELDRLLDSERPPQDMLQQTFKAVQLMAKRQRELEAHVQQTEFIATVSRMLETTAAGGTNASSGSKATASSSVRSIPNPPPAKKARQSFDWLKPNSPKLCDKIPEDRLQQIYLHSNCPAHFATRCAKIMFSGPELVSRNVQGRGKTALDPVKIDRIREYVEKMYSEEEDKETMWANCRRRIDAWGRHLKAVGVPREEENTP